MLYGENHPPGARVTLEGIEVTYGIWISYSYLLNNVI